MNAPPSLLLFLAGGNGQKAESLRHNAINNYAATGIPNPNDVAAMRNDEEFMWRMFMSSFYGASIESMIRSALMVPISHRSALPGSGSLDVNPYTYPEVTQANAYPQGSVSAELLAPFPAATSTYTGPQITNHTLLSESQYHCARPLMTNSLGTSSTRPLPFPEVSSQANGVDLHSYAPNVHQAQTTADRRTSRMNRIVLQDTYNVAHDVGYANAGHHTVMNNGHGYNIPQQHDTTHHLAQFKFRNPSVSRVSSNVTMPTTPSDIYSPVDAPPAILSESTARRRSSAQAIKKIRYRRRPCPSGNGTCNKPNQMHNGSTVWQQSEFVPHYVEDHIPLLSHLLDRHGLWHCEFRSSGCSFTSATPKELAKHVFQEHGESNRVPI